MTTTAEPTTTAQLYFPDGMPVPGPTPDTAPFWEYCRQHELRIQRCSRCDTFRFHPAPVCYNCQSFDFEWVKSRGDARVYSYIIVRQGAHPAVKGMVPYNAAVIALDDCGGVRLTSNVIDCPPEEMAVGMPVSLVWEDRPDGFTLYRFRRRTGDA